MKTRLKEIHYKNGKITYVPQIKTWIFKWSDLSKYEYDKAYAEELLKKKIDEIEKEEKIKDWLEVVKISYLTK